PYKWAAALSAKTICSPARRVQNTRPKNQGPKNFYQAPFFELCPYANQPVHRIEYWLKLRCLIEK
ncbi:MAG: hypothetical protein KDD06_19855, partial [Phaeodactylibacter sp.]|nr:hypothetical protein [Phaeodactylibacter sp.]